MATVLVAVGTGLGKKWQKRGEKIEREREAARVAAEKAAAERAKAESERELFRLLSMKPRVVRRVGSRNA